MSPIRPPINDEHDEAVQASVDRARAEYTASRPPKEQERIKLIEEVSTKLDAAQIPFVLFASPADQDKNEFNFAYFHRVEWLSQEIPYKERYKRSTDIFAFMEGMALAFFNMKRASYATFFDAEKEATRMFDLTEMPGKRLM